MRIAIISPSPYWGGSELAIKESIALLREKGHAVFMIYPKEGPQTESYAQQSLDGFAVISFPWFMAVQKTGFKTKLSTLKRTYTAASQMATQLKQWNIDKVITSTVVHASGALAARRAGIPHYWYLHELGEEDHGLRYILPRTWSLRLMAASTTGFISNSPITTAKFKGIFAQHPFTEVYYVVDTPVLPVVHKHYIPLRLLMPSRITASKGQLEVVKALSTLTDCPIHLTLMGHPDDAYVAQIKAAAASTHLSVDILPFNERLSTTYSQYHAVIINSTKEAFGRVTVEAMKAGLFVIGAEAGATPWLLQQGKYGFLYPFGNAAALAQAVQHLIFLSADEAVKRLKAAQQHAIDLCNPYQHWQGLSAALGI